MIKSLFLRIFIENWQRKLIALLSACAVWFLVHRSLAREKEFQKTTREDVAVIVDST